MKNRLIAALIAFLGGGFGLHKFYLGKNGQGIIYLVFFWTLIPSIIAFFECIMLLMMSDESFDEIYNEDYLDYYEEAPLDLNRMDRLERLAELFEKGIIDQEEFQKEKAYILRH